MLRTMQYSMTEWSLSSSEAYDDPFNQLEVDVIVVDPDGDESRVPAFWSGEQTWRVRYGLPKGRRHRWRSVCSEASDAALHGIEGELDVSSHAVANSLVQRGPLRVSDSGRYLQHIDGTPFFWLADTWWMGLCERLAWPADFQQLTQDRVDKGFTVIQLVAGLFPDMPAFDERGRNEAGNRGRPTSRASIPRITIRPTCASTTSCAAAWCHASWDAGAITCSCWGSRR